MIDALAVGGAVLASGLSYLYGKMRADGDEGCNGHHWGDPYRPDESRVSRPERERAGLPKEVQHQPSKHLTAKVLSNDTVVVRGKAIRKCKDCDERTVEDITVGSVPMSVFESPDDDIVKGTNAADITHIASSVEELQGRLEAVEGIKKAEVYSGSVDDYTRE